MPLLRMTVGAVFVFGLDRLSKILIVHWLDLASVGVIEVRPPYLVLQMAWNKGINFGLLDDHANGWELVVVALVVSLVLTIWVRNQQGWIRPLAVGTIIGGALGNAPGDRRADTVFAQGVRLRYVQCPQAPFLDSTDDNVCEGK